MRPAVERALVKDDALALDGLIQKAPALSGRHAYPRITSLAGDGSDRKFFRLHTGDSSYVALLSPRRKEPIDENDSYLAIGRHLISKGIPAPGILYADVEAGRFLLEDAGDVHLQCHVLRNWPDLEKIYERVLIMLAGLHRKAPRGFSADFCFDHALYDPEFVFEKELEYFRESFLIGFMGLEINGDKLRADFEKLAEAAGVSQTRFVFHRDFQSRNIMVRNNRLWLIDFQGMRFGPPAYDLASLLVDPYVKLPSGLQEKLAVVYWSAAQRFLRCSRGEFLRSYAAVRLCRNLQILGAFAFLGLTKGKRFFLQFIPWAWEQLRQWLARRCGGRYPELEKLVLICDRTAPAQRLQKVMTSVPVSAI
ncbi:MAG: phosphotransferase [Syntrophobacter sp.]